MENTNEQEVVRLPSSLALIVWKELREKHGIEQRRDSKGFPDWSCTREELGLIKKLNIKNPNRMDLVGISLLYNLQSLSISSDGSNDYSKDNNIYTINDKDMQEICKCSSLVSLSINNQADITYISLDKLQNLEYLSINNNRKLEEIDGIQSLRKIWGLSCYGNRTLFEIEGLSEFIKQSPELSELDLDVLLFPDSINFDSKTGEYDTQAFEKINSIASTGGQFLGTVKWHEALPRITA